MVTEKAEKRSEEIELTHDKRVAVIMGSKSDLPIMADALKVLDELGVKYDVKILSAHRSPEATREYAKMAHDKGIKIIIAGAGGAAHLPGVIAAFSHLPIIGVPIESKAMHGEDSVWSIINMPPGVPVGTMAINGAKNAGIYAAEILALGDLELDKRVVQFKENLQTAIETDNAQLETLGWQAFLQQLQTTKK